MVFAWGMAGLSLKTPTVPNLGGGGWRVSASGESLLFAEAFPSRSSLQRLSLLPESRPCPRAPSEIQALLSSSS